MFLLTVATLSCWVLVITGHPHSSLSDKLHFKPSTEALNFRNGLQTTNLRSAVRSKRTTEHHITECIYMTSDEGEFYHEATSVDGTACGVYIFSEPDQRIEIHFNYLDVPCENGGLVSFVDGWELNGQFFPSPADHPRPMQSRFSEFCGKRKIKQVFSSSQNVALIQYRIPERGRRFSFSVRFLKNPTPCNTLLQNTEDIFTLRNYGKRVNCSISTLFPAAVRVAALSVGVVPSSGRGIELETGTLHKCQKRGLDDYVQIGGSTGLDNSDLLLADTVCGIDSKPAKQVDLIGCGTTTVRLISSGAFDNSITVALRQMTEDDVTNGYMSVFCPPEDMLE